MTPTKTICYVYLDIILGTQLINHCFHVVPDNFPIPYDGLIGNDFIKRYKCHIDYENDSLRLGVYQIPLNHVESSLTLNSTNPTTKSCLNSSSDSSPIPNQHQLQNLSSKAINQSDNPSNLPTTNEITLAPRSETIVKIQVVNPEIEEGICPQVPILDDVFLCPSIVKLIDNRHAITSILNTSEKTVKISQLEIVLEPLPHSEDPVYINKVTSNKSFQNSKSDRLTKISESLRTDHLNNEEKNSLTKICHEYNHIFHLEGDTLSYTDTVMHEIPITSSTPINTKSYRYPQIHKEEVDRQISKMLKQNIIEPSSSPWNSPVWVVPKKSDASGKKKWRIVIDYRKLNEITVGDSYPLPNISDILDQLGHSKYFSTIDLTSGFHQIKMAPKDADKTAFSIPTGHYQFKRMPFGLRNAPSTFQRLMNNVLAGIQNIRCFVYLDDIVIFADTLENHNKRLIEIFQRLSDFNLKIQPDKCEFLRREVMYLGHLITENGVKPDSNKIKTVAEYPIPKSPKDIKSFLGLAGYYRRFIKNFSTITQPLTKLLKKDAIFNWTSLQQDSFEKLKSLLCSEPLLQYPDFSKTFYLTTDASNFAIGSVLSQGEPPNDLPIAYASRTLNRAESNYSTTERELLSIVWSVKHFRPYLYGRKFVILTDHKPLTWLFNVKDPGSRLVRWRLTLEEYDYKINYKPGKLNNNADALSRIPSVPNLPESNHQSTSTNVPFPISCPVIHHVETKNEDLTYAQFLTKTSNTLITNNNLEETSDKITTTNSDVALFIPADLEIMNENIKELNIKHNHFQNFGKTLKIGDIKVFEVNHNKIFYVFYKTNYWDSTQYEEIYNHLINLKNTLLLNNITKINIPVICTSYDNLKWNKIRIMIRYIFKDTNIHIIIHHNTLPEPKDHEIETILREYHSSPTSGHSGFHKTYSRIKREFKWPKMKADIKNFIKNCDSCQKNKLVRKKNKNPMEITTTSSKPFERIFLDIVGPLPLTENGNKFILTLQDDLTKFSRAFAIPNHEAETIARKFVEGFICIFGTPQIVVTDQGKDFTSILLKNVSKLFKIKQINCSAYHPQSNGALERSHATLADYLKHYINDEQTDWDDWLNFAMFSYNTSVHTSTKFSPFELIFAHQAHLPSSLTKTPEFKYTYDDYIDEITLKFQKSREIARNNIIQSKHINKKYYDKNINSSDYNIGDKVYLLNEQVGKGKSKKLTQNYAGPYEVIEKLSPVNYNILVKNKKLLVHTNRLKRAFVSG